MTRAGLERRLERLERAAGAAVRHEDWVAAMDGDAAALTRIERATGMLPPLPAKWDIDDASP